MPSVGIVNRSQLLLRLSTACYCPSLIATDFKATEAFCATASRWGPCIPTDCVLLSPNETCNIVSSGWLVSRAEGIDHMKDLVDCMLIHTWNRNCSKCESACPHSGRFFFWRYNLLDTCWNLKEYVFLDTCWNLKEYVFFDCGLPSTFSQILLI
jgi:hypothetical protein